MSVFVMRATSEYPIPKPVKKARTKYRIFSLPQKLTVAKGYASGSISADLDPGKYMLVVHQCISQGDEGQASLMKWKKVFLHPDTLTEAQFKRLAGAPLMFTKGMMTSEGVSYNCTLPGCDNESTSKMAAVLHEGEHRGVDLLADPIPQGDLPPAKVDVAVVEAQAAAERNQAIQRLREAALSGE